MIKFFKKFDGLIVFLTSLIGGTITKPVLISGDGVGYIKRILSSEIDIVPGHLIYVPLLEGLRKLIWPSNAPVTSVVNLALGFSNLSMSIGVLLLYLWARQYYGRIISIIISSGLFLSYGFYRAGRDVEAYSTTVVFLIGIGLVLLSKNSLLNNIKTKIVLSSLLLSGAIFFHTSMVLFSIFPPIIIWLRTKKISWAAVNLFLAGIITFIPFAFISFIYKGLNLKQAISWLLSSDNGYAQPLEFSFAYFVNNILRAVYGLARSFIHSPSPDRLGYDKTIFLFTIGIIFLLILLIILIIGFTKKHIKKDNEPINKNDILNNPPVKYLWVWIIPLAVFGLIFWPSATERWIFILPCIWFAIGAAINYLNNYILKYSIGFIIFIILMLTNYYTISSEQTIDRETLNKSKAIAQYLSLGDLLIYPGHGWDEYIGFYEGIQVNRFILASFVGEEHGNKESFFNRLKTSINNTLKNRKKVVLVRVVEPPFDHHGWSLIKKMGINRDEILEFLLQYNITNKTISPVAIWTIE